jgi:hypothetical protein
MIEKIMLPLTLMFGAVLYYTRDEGFDFAGASVENRASFADRQTRHWIDKANLAPALQATLISVELRDNSEIVIVRIRLDGNTTLIQDRQQTYARACAAYMKSRLSVFAITETVRLESKTGALRANFSFKPGTCERYVPKPV